VEQKSLDTGGNKLNTERDVCLFHHVNYEWLKRHNSSCSRMQTGRDKQEEANLDIKQKFKPQTEIRRFI